ncbi:MAG: GAF domain-containing protein [Anaerolineales bacterium]|nr:GAF domain-containing protein [Anaerolineales bacterium]
MKYNNKMPSAIRDIRTAPSLALRRILLLCAATTSLLGQGFLLAPRILNPILQPLSTLGAALPAIVVLCLSFFLYVSAVQRSTHKTALLWLFLGIQLSAIVGAISLTHGNGSHAQETGYAFSSIVTLLTNLGIFAVLQMNYAPLPTAAVDTNQAEATVKRLNGQVELLTQQLNAEKQRTTQLTYLNELSKQLEAELELEVAAQLAVNAIERAINCTLVSLMWHKPEEQSYVAITYAGKDATHIPSGYQQDSTTGVLGRVTQLKKSQIINDARLDPDFIALPGRSVISLISIPIMQHNKIRSVIEICSDAPYAFTREDIAIAEDIAGELTRAWERASYHQRLKELIRAGISLATLLDAQAAVQEIATIVRKTLKAHFVFISLLDQQGSFSRTASAGDAPKLLEGLQNAAHNETLLTAALNAKYPFRVRDARKYIRAGSLEIDRPTLRSVIAIPIRLHRLSIGAILAFGKQDGASFSEDDESLADLLSSQAAAAIESSWLYQELRNTLNTTAMLYQLSVDVIQAEEVSDAAKLISQAAHTLANSTETGVMLLSKQGAVEVEVEMDANGFHSRRERPQETIDQAIQTGQSIIISNDNGTLVCYPLLRSSETKGALWIKIPDNRGQNFASLQTLANQAAIALDRAILLAESRRQATELQKAYAELEITYDRTLKSLMSALDARDRETEGHSVRVSRLTCTLAVQLGWTEKQIKALERGALLHDIGKIGISDAILHKPDKLTDDEWKIMRAHPDIGARIVKDIPFLQETILVIRHHHERWNGSGYPLGLRAEEIPIEARIFAVADVFDALTSSRKYRERLPDEEALQYMQQHSGILFDPDIVVALTHVLNRRFAAEGNEQNESYQPTPEFL